MRDLHIAVFKSITRFYAAIRPAVVVAAWFIAIATPCLYFISIDIMSMERPTGSPPFLDLRVYRDAATQWTEGNLYDLRVTEESLPFTYPAIVAAAMKLLTLPPLGWMQWMWLFLNVAATYIVVFLSLRYFKPSIPMHVRGVLSAVVLSLSIPGWSNALYGQVNAVLMLLVTLDWLAMKRGRGLLIGIATSIKLTPGIFLLLYAMQRRWREVVYGVGTVAVLLIVSLLFFRADTIDFFTRAMWQPERPGPSSMISNQSMRGALLRFGVDSTLLWLVLALLIAALGAYALYRARFTHPTMQLLIVALTGLLVSPISWVHHWVWVALLPACLLYLWRSNFALLSTTLALLAFTAMFWDVQSLARPPDANGEHHYAELAFSSSLYTWAALVFLVVVALKTPSDQHRQQSSWDSRDFPAVRQSHVEEPSANTQASVTSREPMTER